MKAAMKQTCQRCSEKATLHITEIETDGYREVHLCHKCAHKYLQETDESSSGSGKSIGAAMKALSAEHAESTAVCPVCKLSFADFRASGRLGCPHDYEVFRAELLPLLDNIHDSVRHIGKVPKRLPGDAKQQTHMIQLRQELQQAVAVEDYEKAARLRDQIDDLEKQSQ